MQCWEENSLNSVTYYLSDFTETFKMGEFPERYQLKWNLHTNNMMTNLEQLRKSESFTDVTIAVQDGYSIQCHKLVLAACSLYFDKLFHSNPCDHPVIILSDVQFCNIQSILNYMYTGEVNISRDQFTEILRIARFLKVKGLCDNMDEIDKRETQPAVSPPPTNSVTNGGSHSNGYISPSISNLIHYNASPMDRNASHLPVWNAFPGLPMPQPLPAQLPISEQQVHNLSIMSNSYESVVENPLNKKKKMSKMINSLDTPILRNVLGQSQGEGSSGANGHRNRQDSSSNTSISNGSPNAADRRDSNESYDTPEEGETHHGNSPHHSSKSSSGTRNGQARPEWKRYKQYTREDIERAMLAVSERSMSALQAARKYGVPSRTLYDKLKKAGILPSRGAGLHRRSADTSTGLGLAAGSARFPYQGPTNGQVYGNGAASDNEAESSASFPEAFHALGLQRRQRPPSVEDEVMDMSTNNPRSPSPQLSNSPSDELAPKLEEDEVEDLSLNRRPPKLEPDADDSSYNV